MQSLVVMNKVLNCFNITASVQLTVAEKIVDQLSGEAIVAVGYYQPIRVLAESVEQAKQYVERSIIDGRVLWSDTSIEQETINDFSQSGIVSKGGRALYS